MYSPGGLAATGLIVPARSSWVTATRVETRHQTARFRILSARNVVTAVAKGDDVSALLIVLLVLLVLAAAGGGLFVNNLLWLLLLVALVVLVVGAVSGRTV